MDVFKLSRNFFDWSFENPEKITPSHTALYFFAIEHSNRLWWKEKFWFPSQMAMEAIGIRSYNTYSKVFWELVEWWFFTLIQKSVNQYSANIIALSKNDKATNKALDKALIKHKWKQRESIDSIDIQDTNKQETINNTTIVVEQALVTYWKEWVNDIIKTIKDSVESMNWVYKASTRERQYANHIAEEHKDWWEFLRRRKDWKWNIESVREIIQFSLNPNNSYVKQIINAEDFWNKWADVIMAMRKNHIEKTKEMIEKNKHNPTWNPLLNF